MDGDPRRSGALDRSQPHGSPPLRVPTYLAYFAVPPFLTAFVLAAIDPFTGLVLLACMTIMVIVVNILLRHARWIRAPRAPGPVPDLR